MFPSFGLGFLLGHRPLPTSKTASHNDPAPVPYQDAALGSPWPVFASSSSAANGLYQPPPGLGHLPSSWTRSALWVSKRCLGLCHSPTSPSRCSMSPSPRLQIKLPQDHTLVTPAGRLCPDLCFCWSPCPSPLPPVYCQCRSQRNLRATLPHGDSHFFNLIPYFSPWQLCPAPQHIGHTSTPRPLHTQAQLTPCHLKCLPGCFLRPPRPPCTWHTHGYTPLSSAQAVCPPMPPLSSQSALDLYFLFFLVVLVIEHSLIHPGNHYTELHP